MGKERRYPTCGKFQLDRDNNIEQTIILYIILYSDH